MGLATDADLGYLRSSGSTDGGSVLDEHYRRAHPPLVNPGHPDIVDRRYDVAHATLCRADTLIDFPPFSS